MLSSPILCPSSTSPLSLPSLMQSAIKYFAMARKGRHTAGRPTLVCTGPTCHSDNLPQYFSWQAEWSDGAEGNVSRQGKCALQGSSGPGRDGAVAEVATKSYPLPCLKALHGLLKSVSAVPLSQGNRYSLTPRRPLADSPAAISGPLHHSAGKQDRIELLPQLFRYNLSCSCWFSKSTSLPERNTIFDTHTHEQVLRVTTHTHIPSRFLSWVAQFSWQKESKNRKSSIILTQVARVMYIIQLLLSRNIFTVSLTIPFTYFAIWIQAGEGFSIAYAFAWLLLVCTLWAKNSHFFSRVFSTLSKNAPSFFSALLTKEQLKLPFWSS